MILKIGIGIILLCLCAAACLSCKQRIAQAKVSRCAMCSMAFPANSNMRYEIRLKNGMVQACCCVSCGFMLQAKLQNIATCTTYDYISGQAVPAEAASYIENSNVPACCGNMLAFSTRESAKKFQQQHGGKLFSYKEAYAESNK